MTSSVAEHTVGASALDELSIDTLRLLAVDTVQKANSGHPGARLPAVSQADEAQSNALQVG